jgi:phage protein U
MLKNSIHGVSWPDTAGDRKAASTINLAGARRRTVRLDVDAVVRDGLFCVEGTTARYGGVADWTDFLSGCTA